MSLYRIITEIQKTKRNTPPASPTPKEQSYEEDQSTYRRESNSKHRRRYNPEGTGNTLDITI